MHTERLSTFIADVRSTTLALTRDERFPTSQQELLGTCLSRFFDLSDPNDWAQPLGLLYAIYRGLGEPTTKKAHLVGAFCACYFTAGDLFDDVQDDDLTGKPLESAGVPIAVNSALALLLVGLRALNEGSQLEPDPDRRAGYWDVLNRASLIAIGAQHADLSGLGPAPTPDEVLDMNRGKVACVALVAECGALLGGATPDEAATFREFGSDFAALVQIVDDVRDLFGKAESPDLAAGKFTYPVACFHELTSSEEKAEFSRLCAELPASLEAVRELLCNSGALDMTASAAEAVRQRLHDCLVSLGAERPEHRLLLSMVDALAGTLFTPTPLPQSRALFEPTGGFYDEVQAAAARLLAAPGASEALTPAPTLSPWPAPMYLYEPKARRIHYPDLEGLPAEVIGQFVDALGVDADTAQAGQRAGMPLLLAHEFFHAWRDSVGRLSEDAWHEEFVANRLAMGYALRFEPEAARATVEMSRLILERVPASPAEDELLLRARQEGQAADYALDIPAAARIHARMLLSAFVESDFEQDRARWLEPSASASEAAPIAAE